MLGCDSSVCCIWSLEEFGGATTGCITVKKHMLQYELLDRRDESCT